MSYKKYGDMADDFGYMKGVTENGFQSNVVNDKADPVSEWYLMVQFLKSNVVSE